MSKKKNKKGEIKMNENIEEVVNTNETVEPVVDPEIINSDGETVEDLEGNSMVAPEIEPELPEVEPAEPEAPEMPEPNNVDPAVIAVIEKCNKLNVRKEAIKTSDVVCVIAKGTEVQIDFENSTEDFYKISTYVNDVLVEGYCMKQFINIK